MLEGDLLVSLDGEEVTAAAGDVVLVPAGSRFRLDGGPVGASAWVCTTPGLRAELPDGSTLTPPLGRLRSGHGRTPASGADRGYFF